MRSLWNDGTVNCSCAWLYGLRFNAKWLVGGRLFLGRIGHNSVDSAGKIADDQKTNKHDHQSNENRDDRNDRHGIHHQHALYRMIVDCNGNTPPGKPGVHHRCQQPGAKQEPALIPLVLASLWSEQADDADQVHTTKCAG